MTIDMGNNPVSRSDWAGLGWQEAQHEVANLLNRYGFLTFEEKKYENHKRADVIIKKDLGSRVIIGVIEVKCYQNITRTLEFSAMKQALRYLIYQYELSSNNHRWRNKEINYIVSVIYTNDYPASFLHHKPENYLDILPSELLEENKLYMFTSTPNTLLDKIEQIFPIKNQQSKIDDFF